MNLAMPNIQTFTEKTTATSAKKAPTEVTCMTHFLPLLSESGPKSMAPSANPAIYEDFTAVAIVELPQTRLKSVAVVLVMPLL